MGGGIIINRHAVLMPAAMDPSIYNYLSDDMKNKVETINLKAPGDVTERDIETLSRAIYEACDCG